MISEILSNTFIFYTAFLSIFIIFMLLTNLID